MVDARAGSDEQARRFAIERIHIGQNIRRVRQALAMKQTELGEGVGYAQSSISRIERGCIMLDTRRLSALAAYLGVHPAELWLPPAALEEET